MKITFLEDKAYAIAKVDLAGFKRDLSKHWHMEKAIKHNTEITQREMNSHPTEDLKTLVWGMLDWSGIMDCLSKDIPDMMTIKFFYVKYEDWKRLYPGKINGKEIEFIEENEEGYDTMLIQSLDMNRNFDIKAFIKSGSFRYASTDKLKLGWF